MARKTQNSPMLHPDAPLSGVCSTDAETRCPACGDCYAVNTSELRVLGAPSCCARPTVLVRVHGYAVAA